MTVKVKRNYYLKMEWKLKEKGKDTWLSWLLLLPK